MHYVYLLKSKKNNSLYIGRTINLAQRLKEHNHGLNLSTKRYLPWQCIYFEGYFAEEDAKKRESNLKYFGKSYSQLKRRIKNSLHGTS
ncbi:MAG: GIY-YIG nuclease family protein [Candidatus Harrisonbacteria bacterium]|nr:GIY-YIG nuclease family protein [Candidatus Harrisonbacteria bacterium]